MNYNNIFGAEAALAELIEMSLPVGLALDVAAVYDEIAGLKRNAILALGSNPSQKRIDELAVQTADVKGKIKRSDLLNGVSEIKPKILYNLRELLTDDE